MTCLIKCGIFAALYKNVIEPYRLFLPQGKPAVFVKNTPDKTFARSADFLSGVMNCICKRVLYDRYDEELIAQ